MYSKAASTKKAATKNRAAAHGKSSSRGSVAAAALLCLILYSYRQQAIKHCLGSARCAAWQ